VSVDALLQRLDKVKQSGPGRWVASCPGHPDQTPSISVRELDDGRVLVDDFAGCEVENILGALGLGFDALFPLRTIEDRKAREHRAFPAADVLRAIGLEALIVAVAAENLAHGKPLTKTDHERLMTAAERVTAAVRESGYG
jgi:hypothetical protein